MIAEPSEIRFDPRMLDWAPGHQPLWRSLRCRFGRHRWKRWDHGLWCGRCLAVAYRFQIPPEPPEQDVEKDEEFDQLILAEMTKPIETYPQPRIRYMSDIYFDQIRQVRR